MAQSFRRTFSTCARLLQTPSLPVRNRGMDHLFLPPVNRSMETLDRSFFRKTILVSAAYIQDVKDIASTRTALAKTREILKAGQLKPLRLDPDQPASRLLMLQPSVKSSDPASWSDKLRGLVEEDVVRVKPYELLLTYDDWTMREILDAILPEVPADEDRDPPSGFAQAGHVAHVNLRPQHLPFKTLIGQVLLDKSSNTETVVNKTLDVGSESVYRTFPYEVLAGPDNLDVNVSSCGCEFKFNFGKVYWNTRLETEHERIVAKFQEGQAVCDVMAGVGPFAVPAGKKRVFVHANDLNPDCFSSLEWAITRNKVHKYVRSYCMDGRRFIRSASQYLLSTQRSTKILQKKLPVGHLPQDEKLVMLRKYKQEAPELHEPPTFDHYVMNLPGSAIEFLDAFRGIYAQHEALFASTERSLPIIHLYLFQAKCDTEREEQEEICSTISAKIGASISTNDLTNGLDLHYVRLVSPKKKMYCASFRLPASVAFSKHSVDVIEPWQPQSFRPMIAT